MSTLKFWEVSVYWSCYLNNPWLVVVIESSYLKFLKASNLLIWRKIIKFSFISKLTHEKLMCE